MVTRPYPFAALRRVSKDDAAMLRRVTRALDETAFVVGAEALRTILGIDVMTTTSPLEHCAPRELARSVAEPLVAIVAEHASGSPRARIALELDPRLALIIIDRALGGTGGADVAVPVLALSDTERGVLAYVAARALADAKAPWVVSGVVTTLTALAWTIGDEGAAVVPMRVMLGDDVGVARAWIGEPALAALATLTTSGSASSRARALSAALLTLVVDVVVEAAEGTLAPSAIEALRPGDVVILEETWLRTGDGDGNNDGDDGDACAWAGSLRARIAGATRMRMRCAMSERGLEVTAIDVDRATGARSGAGASVGVSASVSAGALEEETTMEPDTERQVLDRAADAPIAISIEVARFSLPLAELSQVQVGEVLVTGRAIGERVSLRAGDRVIATGELVDVDGEVGVRILELA